MRKPLDLRFGKNAAIQEAQCVGRKEVGGEKLGQGGLWSHYRAFRVYQKNTVPCLVLWSCKYNKHFRVTKAKPQEHQKSQEQISEGT